jgi:hypothetical protein
MTTQHDALVEKMSEAAYLLEYEGQPWWEAPSHRKERFRKQIRAILAVVLAHYSDPANVRDEMAEVDGQKEYYDDAARSK